MRDKIKVLAICTTITYSHSIRGEMEQIVGLRNKGVEIDVLTQANTEYGNWLKNIGLKVFEDYPTCKIDFGFIKRLRKLFHENHYDIVHAFETKGISNSALASRGFRHILIAYRGAAGVYWHDPTAWLSALNPRVNKIICVTDSINRQIKRNLFKKSKTVTIYKGQESSWFKNVKKSNELNPDYFWVVCPARYNKVKGIKYLMKAARYIAHKYPIRIAILGPGTNCEKAKQELGKCQNSSIITLLGPREDALNLIASAEISIMPSLNEGLSRSIIESMCLRKPVIATQVGGNPELVRNNITGILIPSKNPRAIANAIIRLYTNSTLCKSLSDNAFKMINEEFSVERTVERTLALYENFLKIKKPQLLN